MSYPKINSSTIVKIFLVIIFLVTNYRLLRPGILSMQDDLHVFRLQQFDQCLNDGQFPCRYIPDAGLGYGSPVFNFYPPLVYYIAEIFHQFGFSFVESIKLLFIVPGIIRLISMYLLASIFFGNWGGLISAAIFSLAPYQATNTFVRGAIAENLAISLAPLLFYYLHQKNYKLFTLVLFFILLTHHLTLIYLLPAILVFVLIQKQLNFSLIFSGILSLVMSSSFVLPALIEKNLTTVNTMTQGYFDFHNHFANLYQIFISRFWGYGASQWGPVDDMSFQLGYLQWLIPLIILLYLFTKRQLFSSKLFLSFFLIGLFALFLAHPKSNFLWEHIFILPYYQFPWRFLGLATITFGFISGYLITLIPPKYASSLAITIVILALFLNIQFFREDLWFSHLTDNQKLSGASLVQQSGAGLRDYWPSYGHNFPTSFATPRPEITKKSNHVSGTITTIQTTTLTLPLVYFPSWHLTLNGQDSPFTLDPELGLIQINLPSGQSTFELNFSNTPIRTIANWLSIFGFTIYIIYIVRDKIHR
ncbi:MAG: glycosyltransferase family 39 protein [Microgenomates group bacterium]